MMEEDDQSDRDRDRRRNSRDLRSSRVDIEALPDEGSSLMGKGKQFFKVVSSQHVYSKIKSVCNVVAIVSGASVAPFALLSESDLFIGALNLVLVIVPLLYVLAKNMEVEKQNEKLKEEIFALYSKLRIPAKAPPESKDLLANFIVTVLAMIMAAIAFGLVTYKNTRLYIYIATGITSTAIILSGITKMLSARALRVHQNELLSIVADLKALDKENAVGMTAWELEDRNKTLKAKLAADKRATQKKLEAVIQKLEEENLAIKAQLDQAKREAAAASAAAAAASKVLSSSMAAPTPPPSLPAGYGSGTERSSSSYGYNYSPSYAASGNVATRSGRSSSKTQLLGGGNSDSEEEGSEIGSRGGGGGEKKGKKKKEKRASKKKKKSSSKNKGGDEEKQLIDFTNSY
jgi:hypothetical protein